METAILQRAINERWKAAADSRRRRGIESSTGGEGRGSSRRYGGEMLMFFVLVEIRRERDDGGLEILAIRRLLRMNAFQGGFVITDVAHV